MDWPMTIPERYWPTCIAESWLVKLPREMKEMGHERKRNDGERRHAFLPVEGLRARGGCERDGTRLGGFPGRGLGRATRNVTSVSPTSIAQRPDNM